MAQFLIFPKSGSHGILQFAFSILVTLFTVQTAVGAEIRVENILRSADAVQIQWQSEAGNYYNVWYSDSLDGANSFDEAPHRFIPINLSGTGAILSWKDLGDPTSTPPRDSPVAHRFYQILKTTAKLDKFGIEILYRGSPEGQEWYSTWDNLQTRTFTAFDSRDPFDPLFDTDHGDASYSVSDGVLSMSPKGTNSTPRIHIRAPSGQWRYGVECTVYAMRKADGGTNYAGIEIIARTNHNNDDDHCDCRGLGGRIRYDGHTDFEKETSHPYATAVSNKTLWIDGMPTNIWIGCKFVVFDLQNGNVKLQLWMDETDGKNGGDWKLINEFVDTGTNFGVGRTKCALNIDPALKLTEAETRIGSESGKPNLNIRFRTDGIFPNGMLYKKASVREITP